jgi:hypothetical protein
MRLVSSSISIDMELGMAIAFIDDRSSILVVVQHR